MLPERTPYIERQIEEALRFAGIAPGARVLEVGCGMGRYTLGIAERGIAVEGLDLVPFLLEKLCEYARGRSGIPLYCGKARSITSSASSRCTTCSTSKPRTVPWHGC
jgi:ubiquinone/menaquinone biosynthesis C-methylase UbiE